MYTITYLLDVLNRRHFRRFLGKKSKTSYFYIFGYRAYMFLPSKVHVNKLALYSELIIFIGYENNCYCFIHYIQGNIIFHFTHIIFDKKLFPKYTDSYAKKYKLYNKLLNKISSEIELLVLDSSEKDKPALVLSSHTLIPSIWNNLFTCSPSPSLFYKSLSFLTYSRI